MIEEKITPAEPAPVEQPQEPINSSNNQHLKDLVEQVNNTLGNLLGFQVDFAEARVEPDKPEQSIFEEQPSMNSTLTNDMRDEIKTLIDERISQVLKNSQIEEKPAEKKPASNFTHVGITCDGCKKGIHNMARYKSLIKHDYDLCETCERKGIHPGPMVRFSAPQGNHWRLNRIFSEISHHFTEENPTVPSNTDRSHPFGRGWEGRGWGRGGCPRAWNRCNQTQQNQQTPHPNPFAGLQNMAGFDLSQVATAIPGLIENFTKGFQKKTHEATATPAQPTSVEKNQEILKKVQEAVPGISTKMILEVIETHKFTTAQQVLDYLMN